MKIQYSFASVRYIALELLRQSPVSEALLTGHPVCIHEMPLRQEISREIGKDVVNEFLL
jgi:hypothetical protein